MFEAPMDLHSPRHLQSGFLDHPLTQEWVLNCSSVSDCSFPRGRQSGAPDSLPLLPLSFDCAWTL